MEEAYEVRVHIHIIYTGTVLNNAVCVCVCDAYVCHSLVLCAHRCVGLIVAVYYQTCTTHFGDAVSSVKSESSSSSVLGKGEK